MSGWLSSASHSAVVPHFACPTMKKSGTRPRTAGGVAVCSVEAVIAPERDEVALQVLADRLHLGLEAPAQLEHELLVHRLRLAVDGPLLDGVDQVAPQAPWSDLLDRAL